MNTKINKILKKKNKSKILCLTAYSKNFAEEIDKYVDMLSNSLDKINALHVYQQEVSSNPEA